MVDLDTEAAATQTVTGLSSEITMVRVFNGAPGASSLDVNVNGTVFQVTNLLQGEERLLAIGSAIQPGTNNHVTLTATGSPGGRLFALIN
jgi:hypothetical protein